MRGNWNSWTCSLQFPSVEGRAKPFGQLVFTELRSPRRRWQSVEIIMHIDRLVSIFDFENDAAGFITTGGERSQ